MVQRNTWAEVSLGESVINVSYFVGVDGISMLLVLLTTFIMPISILGSFGSHIFEERGREKLYYIFLMLLEWAMIGVFVVHDLIIFYVFWEVTLVPMYFLIGIWGAEEPDIRRGQILPLYDGGFHPDADCDSVCRQSDRHLQHL